MTSRFSAESIWTSMRTSFSPFWDKWLMEDTTLRIIAGFEEPSGGEVLFNGIEISKLPPYKREVNTVFQKYALFPHLNVAENIGFGLNLKKVDKDVIAQKVTRMLKMVGLEGFEKRDVTLLSGGQQQRVAIAVRW